MAVATVVTGGGRPDRAGAFFIPTILTDITPDVSIYDTELFGPVACVYRVKDEEEALKTLVYKMIRETLLGRHFKADVEDVIEDFEGGRLLTLVKDKATIGLIRMWLQ